MFFRGESRKDVLVHAISFAMSAHPLCAAHNSTMAGSSRRAQSQAANGRPPSTILRKTRVRPDTWARFKTLVAQIPGEGQIGIVTGEADGNNLAVTLDDDSAAAREIIDYRSRSPVAKRSIQTPSRG
jgi:hypothetical protein